MNIHTIHLGKVTLYASLSLTDFFLTYHLLQRTDGAVYESNPIANAWLHAYGWAGLVAYKALAVLLVVGVAVFISRSRPRTAGNVLKFGCCTVGGVVLYSCWLSGFLGTGFSEANPGPTFPRISRRNPEFRNYVNQVRQDWLAPRCTHSEVPERLARTEQAQNPGRSACLGGYYPGPNSSLARSWSLPDAESSDAQDVNCWYTNLTVPPTFFSAPLINLGGTSTVGQSSNN
jgi:hypothetical protein